MSIVSILIPIVSKALYNLYGKEIPSSELTISHTKPEFEGDYTVVLFSFVKSLRKAPEQLGNELGAELLKDQPALITKYNVIKGFLNLTINDSYWIGFLNENYSKTDFGALPANDQKVIVEYSSPNTNKPLHLGHLRNNFLGWSVAEILKFTGHSVVKTSILNDRGIHICKSMVSWQLFGECATPQSTGIKGDHLVGIIM